MLAVTANLCFKAHGYCHIMGYSTANLSFK